MKRTHAVPAVLLTAASLAVVAAGCGGDDSSGSEGNGGSSADMPAPSTTKQASAPKGALALAADPSGAIKFDKTTLAAKAGKVTIDFQNASQTPHAVEIEGHGVEKETKTITGGKASLTANLKPGTYTFYCPVADHREEGMKGTLTVK